MTRRGDDLVESSAVCRKARFKRVESNSSAFPFVRALYTIPHLQLPGTRPCSPRRNESPSVGHLQVPPHIARLELYRPHLNYRHSWPTRGNTDMDSQQQQEQEQAPRSAGHYTTLTDPTFLVGLESILQPFFQQGAPEDEIRGIAQRAEAFYLSNHAEPDLEQPQPLSALAPPPKHPLASSSSATTVPTAEEQQDQPPYPPTFAELAQLIATGAPVPGIRDIPDQLAAEPPTESTAARKRKPWETRDDPSSSSGADSTKDQEQASRQVARALGLTTATAEAQSQDDEMQDS